MDLCWWSMCWMHGVRTRPGLMEVHIAPSMACGDHFRGRMFICHGCPSRRAAGDDGRGRRSNSGLDWRHGPAAVTDPLQRRRMSALVRLGRAGHFRVSAPTDTQTTVAHPTRGSAGAHQSRVSFGSFVDEVMLWSESDEVRWAEPLTFALTCPRSYGAPPTSLGSRGSPSARWFPCKADR